MTLPGLVSTTRSKELTEQVIELLSHYNGTQAEIEKLEGYLAQTHSYTVIQERAIESMWMMYDARRKK